MAWNFILGGASAKDMESGAEFAVTYRSRNIQSVDDFDVRPTGNSVRKWTEEELHAVKEKLWEHHTDRRIRDDLAVLIQREFFGENHRVANAITQVTGKKVSERTIQAWLIDPSRVSSRKCPAWALKAIHDYLAAPENKRHLEELAQYRKEFPQQPQFLDDVYDKKQVGMATTEIECEKRARKRWEEASYNSLPTQIYELEKRVDGYLHYLSNTLATITNTLASCNDFDEFKRRVSADIEAAFRAESAVRRARTAIEEGREEFSNEEGLAE
ncbi:hypothetical protein U5817_17280 [Aromatoleum evansii]|uniref:Uncharacterized protein n=1 Tax=Aromatoleum evansii TaxID=59406 RepID=A0ABZ1AGE8_AROEV|nr:hypothetical protein U5817_17280 [Aromatoleum evansii]